MKSENSKGVQYAQNIENHTEEFKSEKIEEKKVDYFSLLNDECVIKNIDYLNSIDIRTLGETCNRLRKLTGDRIHYKIMAPLRVSLSSRNYHVKYSYNPFSHPHFEKFICENIDRDIEKYIKRNHRYSQTVSFYECYLERLDYSLPLNIINCDTVNIIRCSGQIRFLQRCPHVAHLIMNSGWDLLPIYNVPALKSFEFTIYNQDNAYELRNFFRFNSNVQQIICRFDKHFDKKYVVQYFKTIIANNMGSHELFFEFQTPIHFSLIVSQLKIVIASEVAANGTSNRMKQFVLFLDESEKIGVVASTRSLSSLNVSGLSGRFLTDVKYILLNYGLADGLSKYFINMEVLYLANVQTFFFIDWMDRLVKHMPSLQQIFIIGNQLVYHEDAVRCLNEIRKVNRSACNLTIYLDPLDRSKLDGLESIVNQISGRKLIQFELAPESLSQGISFNKPSQRHYVDEI